MRGMIRTGTGVKAFLSSTDGLRCTIPNPPGPFFARLFVSAQWSVSQDSFMPVAARVLIAALVCWLAC